MPKSELLLTVGTGYIGFRILVEASNSGYSVTVAARFIFTTVAPSSPAHGSMNSTLG